MTATYSLLTAAAGRRGLGEALIALSPPVNLAMTLAVRRAARRRPEAFERLGPYRGAAFLICPSELPVGFRLAPHPVAGRVRVTWPDELEGVAARIVGPIAELLGLFDGTRDADAAFFSRTLEVEGDTGAVVALHNALEAAELTLADLTAAPAFAAPALNRAFAGLLRAAGRAAPGRA